MTDSIVQHKTCRTCNTDKPVFEFRKSRLSYDGYVYICNSCKDPLLYASMRRREMRTCPPCGAQFESRMSDAKKYCAPACAKSAKSAKRLPVEVRFWSKVRKTDGCWVWTGGTSRFGYGLFRATRKGRYAAYCAHIVSYEIAHGPVPDGLCVLHKCDNPPCVRPDHLYLGTKHDNNMDMVARERTTSNLTAEQVKEMRALYAAGVMGCRKLGEIYGVHRNSVRGIINRRTWAHIP